ncbi:acetyl-CoA carboxylase biotin carboxyl carrier protein [Thermophilibacter mediterraneus]|uniref:acetyl-CoA carboxylase biotin carboxyl carrier protein n=1 Tax=Thermophilibacter mediterraneus TaxID=1871031 RepID=UPI000930A424|nr:acetyl-CoA carboxylase biotin carboxyl carrier protein [Thermophilibacter mediterraneus]
MDASKIAQVADIMTSRGLTRVRVEEPDGSAIELECGPVAPAPEPVAASDDAPLDMSHTTAVRAPMVGVFYAAPAPGAEPFVHVGSKVKKGETLCVIEAMKVMNEVTAEADGEIVDICVHDGDLVEYGCCLMKIY